MSFTSGSVSKSAPDRHCSRENCKEVGESTIKYFYDGKQIIKTPLTPKKVDGGLDLCLNHSKDYVAPAGWTLVNKLVMPSYLTQQAQTPRLQSSGALRGGDTFFGFIVLVATIGILFLVGSQVIQWLSEMDWGNNGTYIVQVPTKVRRP
jgi:hypothetical protein